MAAAQCFCVDDACVHSRQFQRTISRPSHDVEKYVVSFASRGAPRARFEWTTARAINAVAVLLQPRAHFRESSHLARIDSPVWHRSDIEKEITVAACRLQKRLQAFLEGLQAVIWIPRPVV